MPEEYPPDSEVERLLTTLRVESLCQWDVLVFLYRHPTSLLGADAIARLLGYVADPVLAALDVLEALGLVVRSRVSQNVRLYQFTVPPEPPRGEAFARLLELAGDRAGRLILARQFRRREPPPQDGLAAARRVPDGNPAGLPDRRPAARGFPTIPTAQ
jgi:hypothetical protein